MLRARFHDFGSFESKHRPRRFSSSKMLSMHMNTILVFCCYHWSKAVLIESCRRACKDEMKGCLQDEMTIWASVRPLAPLWIQLTSGPLTQCHLHGSQLLWSHLNIVKICGAIETPPFSFIILEFVPGEDLFYLLQEPFFKICPACPLLWKKCPFSVSPQPLILAGVTCPQLTASIFPLLLYAKVCPLPHLS